MNWLLCLQIVWAFPPALQGPFFWETKPLVRKALYEERKIPVSVTREGNVWVMKGAGIVQAPPAFVLNEALNFSNFTEAHEHFSEVEFPHDKSFLKLRVKSRFTKEPIIFSIEKSDSQVNWKVREGAYRDSEGFFRVLPADGNRSEVALVGLYPGRVAWYLRPGFALGVEAVMQHVASSLRSKFEEKHKKAKSL